MQHANTWARRAHPAHHTPQDDQKNWIHFCPDDCSGFFHITTQQCYTYFIASSVCVAVSGVAPEKLSSVYPNGCAADPTRGTVGFSAFQQVGSTRIVLCGAPLTCCMQQLSTPVAPVTVTYNNVHWAVRSDADPWVVVCWQELSTALREYLCGCCDAGCVPHGWDV